MEQENLTSVKLESVEIMDFTNEMSSNSNLGIKEEINDESQQEQIWIPADIYEHVYEIENAPMASNSTNQIYVENIDIKNENLENSSDYQVEDTSVVIGGEESKLFVEEYAVKQEEFGTQPSQQHFITVTNQQGDLVYQQQMPVDAKRVQDITRRLPPPDLPLEYPSNVTSPENNPCGSVSSNNGQTPSQAIIYQDTESFYNTSVTYPCQEFSLNTDTLQTQGIKRKLISVEETSENSRNKTTVLDRIESIITSNDKIVTSNNLQSNKSKENANKRSIVLWKCNSCTSSFTNEEKLKQHSCHNITTVDSESTVDDSLTCEKCFITFDSQNNYDLHTEFHANYPDAIYCKNCFQLLSSTDDLILHLESDRDCADEYSLEQRLKAFQNYNRIILIDEKTQADESGCSSSEIVIPDLNVSSNQPDFVQDLDSSSSGMNTHGKGQYVTQSSDDSEFCVIEYTELGSKESVRKAYQSHTQNTTKKSATNTQNAGIIQSLLLSNNASSSSQKHDNIPKVSDNENLDKLSLSDRIDQLINRNKKIMNDTKISSKYPNHQKSEQKKKVVPIEEVISQRIESIINKNNLILNSAPIRKGELGKEVAIDLDCSECLVKFPTASALKKHNKTTIHGEIKQCSRCDCYFRNSYFYNNHIKNEHKLCEVCNETFKTLPALKAHSDDHELGKIEFYLCNYCNNEYKNMKLLAEHLKIEHGIIPSVKFKFETVKKYSTHETIIPQIKFKCNYCDQLFIDSVCLTEHVNTLHVVNKH